MCGGERHCQEQRRGSGEQKDIVRISYGSRNSPHTPGGSETSPPPYRWHLNMEPRWREQYKAVHVTGGALRPARQTMDQQVGPAQAVPHGPQTVRLLRLLLPVLRDRGGAVRHEEGRRLCPMRWAGGGRRGPPPTERGGGLLEQG